MGSGAIEQLQQTAELGLNQLLDFWEYRLFHPETADFHSLVDHTLQADRSAPKHIVLTTRLVWTFAAAFRRTRKSRHLRLARFFYEYLQDHFLDRDHGGYYWEIAADGSPAVLSKRLYGQSFALYAVSEYARIAEEAEAKEQAGHVYRLIEERAYDPEYGGCFEGFSRDWQYTSSEQLTGINPHPQGCKTMNTHLHLLEAHTNFHRLYADEASRQRLKQHLQILSKQVLHPQQARFQLFFDRNWNSLTEDISYGHDIEGSWLLWEAAELLGDAALINSVKDTSVAMAESVYKHGWHPDGGLLYEYSPEAGSDTRRSWWVQSEAVVGFVNAWQLTRDERFLEAALSVWSFIDQELIDREHGGWYAFALSDQRPSNRIDGFTCPYHNARMYLEVLDRLDQIKRP